MIEDKIIYNDYWERVQEKDREIERLENIIKEVREYITTRTWFSIKEILEILDKGE